jgi:hypothetical protein
MASRPSAGGSAMSAAVAALMLAGLVIMRVSSSRFSLFVSPRNPKRSARPVKPRVKDDLPAALLEAPDKSGGAT